MNVNRLVKVETETRGQNTENAIYFNFSYAALKLLGKNLYNNAANAISEIVANSIDAKAESVYVYIDMTNKAHSTIEIIDNGSGMSYEDLAEKYVWIGRNKRNDKNLTDQERQNIMGRKGIGKLAALYLTNQYYILTKCKNIENCWEVNLSAYADSEFPKMDRVDFTIPLVNQDLWNGFSHGTVIKLKDVDLRQNGDKKIEGLRRTFADFYLLNAIGTKIYVAVRKNKSEPIDYQIVEKKIAFRNFYAIYDISSLEIYSKMQKGIAFTWAARHPEVGEKKRETINFEVDKSKIQGKKIFKKTDGTTVEKDYKLTGWIAIHCTIEQRNAQDPNFLRNSVYQANRLRLYVRNKIAVEDYYSISPSTQAMANYIEGEISFNILDDDDLPDIATSSRQDFLDDERIELLVSIVDPILNKLYNSRNKIGKQITDEDNEIDEVEKRRNEERIQAEAAARQQAEEERVIAEQQRDVAIEQKEHAEEIAEKAKEESKIIHRQSNTIFSAMTEDQKTFSAKTHLVKTNALTIRNSISTLADKIGYNKYKEIGAIALTTDKILSVLKYSALAKFNIEDAYIIEDLFLFCQEYIEQIIKRQYINIEFSIICNERHMIRFNPQHITMIFDNLIANSEKSNSRSITVKMHTIEDGAEIIVSDDGKGLGHVDKEKIFEFGFSNTGGTGIGLYNVKNAVERLNGSIQAQVNASQGATFVIKIP